MCTLLMTLRHYSSLWESILSTVVHCVLMFVSHPQHTQTEGCTHYMTIIFFSRTYYERNTSVLSE